MSNNLSIENLSRIVDAGDAGALLGNGGATAPGKGIASEARVTQVMQENGMTPTAPAGNPGTFSSMLRDSVQQVNNYQVQADTAVKELVAGRNKNIHETMLAVERADTSLKMMMQVRNKVLDAYKEIMRMQV